MNHNELSFEEFFGQAIKDHGLTLKKVSELTGISIKHLEALARGNFTKLPSAPYFRGYIQKLARLLNFDAAVWWAKFKEGGLVKDASTGDVPPENRFIRPTFVKFFWIGGAALAVFLYLGFRFSNIFGMPIISLSPPLISPMRVTDQAFTLSGTLENGTELSVNGDPVFVNADGTWSKTVLLQSGTNTLEITARKFLGREIKLIEQVVYENTSTTPFSAP